MIGNSEMRLALAEIESPLGPMLAAAATGGHPCALDFADCRDRMETLLARRYGGAIRLDANASAASLAVVAGGIARYFEGDLDALNAIPVDMGGTTFQREIWSMLQRIPAGSTISYQELAVSIGRPSSSARAAGAAIARNPIALVIPCHRVIGSGGSLTGYAGGIERKRWLIEHEARAARSQSRSRIQLGRKSLVALATSE